MPPQAPGTPVFISANVEVGENGNLAFDASGAAVAVWQKADKVWANHYDGNSKTWGQSVMIGSAQSFASTDAQIVATSPGHMLAIWNAADSDKRDERSYGVWSAVYNAKNSEKSTEKSVEEGQWANAVPVSRAPPAFSTHHPRVAVNSSHAVAVWLEYFDASKANEIPAVAGPPKSSRIMSAVYTAGKGWGTPMQISDNAAATPEEPEVSIDKLGRATAVWLQRYDLGSSTPSARRLYYSVLQPQSSRWTTPLMLDDPDPLANVQYPAVSSNGAGDTVIAWVQTQGKCYYAMAARSVKHAASQKQETVWEPAVRLTPEWPALSTQPRSDGMDYPCFITEVTAAIDAAGNAMVAWEASSAQSTSYLAFAPAGQPWRAQAALPYSEGASAGDMRMVFTAPGKAVVLSGYGRLEPPRRRVVKHHFDANNNTQPWSASQLIDWPNGSGAFGATLAVSPNGQTISTWQQSNLYKSGFSAYTWNINDAVGEPTPKQKQ